MAVPVITGEALVVGNDGATLRHTQSGQAVSNVRLKFSDRRRKDDGTWEDSATLWIDATAWGPLAERLAEVGSGGTVLKVSGRLDTREWEHEGQKRSSPRLTLEMLEPKERRETQQRQSPPPQQNTGWGTPPASDGGSWDQPGSQPDPWG